MSAENCIGHVGRFSNPTCNLGRDFPAHTAKIVIVAFEDNSVCAKVNIPNKSNDAPVFSTDSRPPFPTRYYWPSNHTKIFHICRNACTQLRHQAEGFEQRVRLLRGEPNLRCAHVCRRHGILVVRDIAPGAVEEALLSSDEFPEE